MQKNPHGLIEGIVIAAYAIGATKAFIYIRGEYVHQADVLDAAVAEAARSAATSARTSSARASSSRWSCTAAPGAYICGEETGLLDSLEGKRGNPRLKPPFPANQGLFQGPTLINNVETLATLPHIVELGAEAYAEIGVKNSAGTKLVSVSGNVQRPGNYEIELGMTSRDIIYGLAGGPPEGRAVKLWFPGGSSSPVLTADDLDLPYDFDSMAEAGSMLGSGAIIVVDDSQSVVDVCLKLAKFYAHESCGKCTPCREGTNWTVKMLQRVDDGTATPMDLDIMASVQERIIGNCLCVLGDAMAMPVGSMIAKFRGEFEAHIEAARARERPRRGGGERRRREPGIQGAPPRCRARRVDMITFTLDGREVSAPQNMMLVDAALKYGDVEIPVFCYEPKLGAPVGACRMCLVEIEGIPKLQAGCSVAGQGRDGRPHRDRRASRRRRRRSLEFLLINHPLDCPVCDKGGECPLQDKSFGWGGGISRMIEPKRHFEKPLALSPLDRDRPRALHPLLPLRALQPGGQRGLPADPPGARRAHLRRDVRRPSVRRAVQRQHHRALPRRRADLAALPLPRAALGHRAVGLGLHALPGAVQHQLHGPRRARAARAGARQRRRRRRLALRQGPLRLPGDPRRRAHHAAAAARRRRAAPGQLGARDRGGDVRAGTRAQGRVGALVGGDTTNEEGWLSQRLDARGARLARPRLARGRHAAARPAPRARGARRAGDESATSTTPHAVLVLDTEPVDDAPILDLRIRKGVRRGGVKLFVATSRPSSLDERAARSLRFAPGAGEALLAALDAALAGSPAADVERLAGAAGAAANEVSALAKALRSAGRGAPDEIVILFGERLTHGPRGEHAARALLSVAGRLGLAGRDGAGLLQIPAAANGRGLREVGVLPNAGPGLSELEAGRDAAGIAQAAAAGELTALYLCTPTRCSTSRAAASGRRRSRRRPP